MTAKYPQRTVNVLPGDALPGEQPKALRTKAQLNARLAAIEADLKRLTDTVNVLYFVKFGEWPAQQGEPK
jgi:hypothetical protein